MTNLTHKPTRRQVVVNGVMDQIRSGVLRTGDKLLPTDKLAAHYGVSVPTAHKAVRELVDQGFLSRKTGAGTFVTEPDAPQTNRTVGLLIASSDHLWDEVARNLLVGLRDLEVSPILVSMDGLNATQVAALPAFRQLVAMKPEVVVTSGYGMPEVIREALPQARIISLLSGRQSPMYQVVPDFGQVGRLCGEHMAAQGFERVDFMDVSVVPDLPNWQTQESAAINRSLEEALMKNGSAFGQLVRLRGGIDSDETGQIIREYLLSPDRARALVCRFSHRSMEVWRHARDLGLRIPEDLALLSTLDTPMTRNVGISAVDQRFGEMATVCVQLIASELASDTPLTHTTVRLIQPQLVVRGSTKNTANTTR